MGRLQYEWDFFEKRGRCSIASMDHPLDLPLIMTLTGVKVCTLLFQLTLFAINIFVYVNNLRNIGPLKTVMDLVITSKDIARAGEYICSMASNISTQCPDGKSKNDLQAYMDRMKLYCHQLKITSSVRADSKSTVQTVKFLVVTVHGKGGCPGLLFYSSFDHCEYLTDRGTSFLPPLPPSLLAEAQQKNLQSA